MSQCYTAGDVVLWNPSMRASALFLGQVRLFEKEFGLASGVGSMESDSCEVDVAVFGTFARTLAADPTLRSHSVVRTLGQGFVVTVLAVAQRAGLTEAWPPASDALEGELRESARSLEPSLAR